MKSEIKQNLKGRGSDPNSLVNRLLAEKKKGVMALCLIVIMVFMWSKVLSGKKPKAAGAATTQQEAMDKSDQELKISFIELPKVAGRNDVLTRDFFSTDGFARFVKNREGKYLTGFGEVSVTSGNEGEGIEKRIAEGLRLEAIGVGESLQAFINGQLLSVGDKLLVDNRGSLDECEVIGIEETKVFIRCGSIEIQLQLMP